MYVSTASHSSLYTGAEVDDSTLDDEDGEDIAIDEEDEDPVVDGEDEEPAPVVDEEPAVLLRDIVYVSFTTRAPAKRFVPPQS